MINKLKNSQDFKDLKLEKTNAELTELTSGAKDKNKKSGANVFSMLKSSSKPTIVALLEKSTNPSDNLTDEALTKEKFVQLAKEENLVYNFFNLGKNKAGIYIYIYDQSDFILILLSLILDLKKMNLRFTPNIAAD